MHPTPAFARNIPSLHRTYTRAGFLFAFLFLLLAGMILATWSSAHAQDAGPVVINEIHYRPDLNTEWIEFIELHNRSAQSVDLTGWKISDGVNFTFPANTRIAAGGYLLIGEYPPALARKFGVSALGPYEKNLSSSGETLVLTDQRAQVVDEVEYGAGFPWPISDGTPDRSIQLLNPAFDNSLPGNWRSNPATPAAANAGMIANTPPLFSNVTHTPRMPGSNQDVVVRARVFDTDGIAQVRLLYQVVPPGQYISIQDAAYEAVWTPIAMTPEGDDVFAATLPARLNAHRTLVRYRIDATDNGGRRLTIPYADDPQPNFAYFVYNGLPQWQATYNGATENKQVFDFNQMRPLPVYHFIGKQMDIADALFINPSTWPSGYMGSDERWRGTLVYDGEVFDHVSFRARGGDFRYATGKSNWRINLNYGHRIQTYDDYGNPHAELADKINLYGISQQIHRDRRGEHGMFDSMTYRLYKEAGVAAPNTQYIHLRVIDGQYEYGGGQYWGDFWGLYLSVEHPDGRFLDNHGLPDGNLYKIENYQGDLDNLSRSGPEDGSDVNAFLHATTGKNPDANWWKQNFDLDNYYSFRAILEFTHDYDVDEGKNYYYFHNDETNKWMILPWDKDLTWYLRMPGSGIEPLVTSILSKPEFRLAYQNRVRELRDLLLNQEQIFAMLDENANLVDTPTWGNSMVDADRFMWDYNPMYGMRYVDPLRTAPGHYYISTPQRTFRAMVEQMKQYALERFVWMDATLLADKEHPATPALTYAGGSGFPANNLRFAVGDYTDPQGAGTFAALEWRVAEITNPAAPAYDPDAPILYEIDAVWQSAEIGEHLRQLVPPAGSVQPGHTYRVRVRMKDNSGRWSHWSAPVQFTANAPTGAPAPLVISELMYHPLPFANIPGDELEFVEIYNAGAQPVALDNMQVVGGIEYVFPRGAVLNPGDFAVLAENEASFLQRYGIEAQGKYSGKLSNGGEEVTLLDAWGRTIFSVTYSDDAPWPEQADGDGYSLVYIPGAGDPNTAAAWRRSMGINGSPGAEEPAEIVINEVVIAPEAQRAVELFNPGNAPVNVSYWFLSDDQFKPRRVQIPAGSIIPPGGYLVVNAATLGKPSYDGAMSFTPQPSMEIALSSAHESGRLTGYQTFVVYSAPDAGLSAGSHVDSEGNTQFPIQSAPTLGSNNAGPRVGPVVISALLYDAPLQDQFVELTNISGQTVNLYTDAQPVQTWQLQGGFYNLPAGVALPPNGRLLITGGSPHDACALMVDRGYVRILGPMTLALSSHGQAVTLQRPIISGMALVDLVEYKATAPWPNGGANTALLRSNLSAYGNDPANWQAAGGWPIGAPAGTLCALTATQGTGTAADIAWTLNDTSQTQSITGFKLWRSADGNRANAVEISSVDAAASTATYAIADSDAQAGTIYTYWLEAIADGNAGGSTVQLGMTTTQQEWQHTQLPVIEK